MSRPADARQALDIGPRATARERTIDITTTGARTGLPRRIEIWFWHVGQGWYLASEPGARDWHANLLAHPELTVHLTGAGLGSLQAYAEPITEPDERRRILSEVIRQAGRSDDVDSWVAGSPLVRLRLHE